MGDIDKTPKAVREMIAHDEKPLVIKQYTPEGLDMLFPEDKEPSVMERAQKLKARQAMTKKFFEQVLPEGAIPESLFVVGGPKDDARLYELQEKVSVSQNVFSLMHSQNPVEELSPRFLPEAIHSIGKQLRTLVDRARDVFNENIWKEFPELKYKVFDLLSLNNIVIDREGNVRMYDTNALFDWSDGSGQPEYKEMYQNVLSEMEKLADRLIRG